MVFIVKILFSGEQHVPGEHAGHTGDLLLLVHHIVPGYIGLEIKSHLPADPSHDGQEVPGMCLPLDNMTK